MPLYVNCILTIPSLNLDNFAMFCKNFSNIPKKLQNISLSRLKIIKGVKKQDCRQCFFFNSCPGVVKISDTVTPFIFKELRINLDCNQNCLFCNTDINAENVILNTEQIKQTVISWAKAGVNCLTISGKEPTLHADLREFISVAKNNHYKRIGLQTNALRFADRTYCYNLKRAGLNYLFVSFHSCFAETYNQITRSTTFSRAVEGIKNIMQANIFTVINVVINRYNYKELPEIVIYIIDNFTNAKGIVFSFVAPVCEALKNKEIIPRITTTLPYLKKAIQRARAVDLSVRIPARCGIPMCFLRDFLECFDCLWESSFWKNPRDKIKMPICVRCKLKGYCDGFWKEYVKLYGFH